MGKKRTDKGKTSAEENRKTKIRRKKELGLLATAGILIVLLGFQGKRIFLESGRSYALAFEEEKRLETGRMTEDKMEDETESESETEVGAGLESETMPALVMESELLSETIFEPGSEIMSESVPEHEEVSGLESETTSAFESEPLTEAISEVEFETTSASESETALALESEPLTEAISEVESETAPAFESEPLTEVISEVESETAFASESETTSAFESESLTEAVSEEESETVSDLESETVSDLESEPLTESVSEGESETASDLESETAPAPESEPISETVSESEPETAAKSETSIPEQTEPPKPPAKIQRGKHYEIVGDESAWYRDGNDRLWVRAGTNLYIETKAESGYNRGLGKENLQADGALTFSLKKTDEQGNILAESEIRQEDYYVDGEAPEAKISVAGVEKEGVVYAAQSAEGVVAIAPDGKSGLKEAAYSVIPCNADGSFQIQPEEAGWTACGGGEQISLKKEGTYCIYVRTEDQVGNLAFSKSSLVCVDSTPPSVSIEGVGDQTANSGTVRIRAACQDSYYREGSMEVSIKGVNEGKIPSVYKKEENGQGAVTEYLDFPRQRSYDDIYQMSVCAQDIAGNTTKREMIFSINRYGSVYDLSEETKENLEQYYLTEAKDVIFYETNIDYVGESEIFCRRDGELERLKRGRDYRVTMEGSRESWKQYQYTILSEYFDREGVYELLLSSGDQAENQSDTGIQEKKVAFVLDWTSPDCTITGIGSQQVYDSDFVTACISASDNIGVKTMRVYRDSKLMLEKTEKELGEEPVKVTLEGTEGWQTLQVFLRDMAGNDYWSDEIPIYVKKGAADVPVYQKSRASAQELEDSDEKSFWGEKSEENEEEAAEEAGSRISERTLLSAKKKEAGISGRENEEKESILTGRKAEGELLLILGIVVFIATASACIFTGLGRKR